MDQEWITALRTLRGEFVKMGGKGSGHHRHAGRKGKRGGSAPSKGGAAPSKEVGGVSSELKPITNLMTAHTEIKDLGDRRKYYGARERKLSRGAHTGKPSKRAQARAQLASTREVLSEIDSDIEKNEGIIKGLSSAKAPGFGEWADAGTTRDPLTRQTTYKHPSYGQVAVSIFAGAPQQKMAASAVVKFRSTEGKKTFQKEWAGKKSSVKAKDFLKKHWGI